MPSGRFQYVIFDLAIAFGIYAFFILVCIVIRWKFVKQYCELHFEGTFNTVFGHSRIGVGFLLSLRFGFFLFFSIFAGALNYANTPTAYQFLTHWTVAMHAVYFFFATITSIMGLTHHTSDYVWARDTVNFGKVTHILYEITTSVAFFITFFDLVFLNRKITYPNVTQHMATTFAMLVETSLNAMLIRLDHLAYALTYVALYVITIAALVLTNTLRKWPYFFMDNSTTFSYVWWALLTVAIVIFYLIAYGISQLKLYFVPDLSDYTLSTTNDAESSVPEAHIQEVGIDEKNHTSLSTSRSVPTSRHVATV